MAGFLTHGGATDLKAFLREMAARPFKWGETDCALMIADWVSSQRGVPVADGLRGSYGTEDECADVLAGLGGLRAVVSCIAENVPLNRTDNPAPGDIGITRCPVVGEICGIRTDRGWAMKTKGGLMVVNTFTLVAWEV